jgi:glycosyltransferase involved in cell wall biosynthesis
MIALRLILSACRYRLRICGKAVYARWARPVTHLRQFGSDAPQVTIFISNLNTRYAVELTLRSLLKHNKYPAIRVIVADNASSDDSREFLKQFAIGRPVTVVEAATAQPHAAWLDQMMRSCDTPYLVAVDSDMLFLGGDPIGEMISVMESQPELGLLTAGLQPFRSGVVEPVGGVVVDQSESPFTWLMCIRSTLREQIDSSFAVVVVPAGGNGGRPLVNDTGACLLQAMIEASIRYAVMPKWFATRFEHLCSMSWTPTVLPNRQTPYGFMRSYKADDAKRRAARLRKRGSA